MRGVYRSPSPLYWPFRIRMLEYAPIAAFLLLFQILRSRFAGLRLAFLAAAALWTAFVVVVAETLGFFHAIHRTALAPVWLAACAGLAFILFRSRSKPATLWSLARTEWRALDLWTRALAAASALLAAILGATALLSAPNTYDVMAYHMPRVMIWMQQRTLAFFPTQMANMNFMPPGNELIQLTFAILGQDDVLANATQWFAWLGVLAAVSLSLKLLGADRRGQWLGLFLAATLPQGVLVATGAKNDVTLSFWLVASLAFALAFGQESSRRNATLLALAAALALLTKSLAWFLLPSFGLALLLVWKRPAWMALFRQAGVILPLIILVSGPFWLRSYREYGSITGPRIGNRDMLFGYECERFTPGGIAANVIRNLAVQFNTGPDSLHQTLDTGFRSAVSALGQDPDDQQSLWPGSSFHLQPFYWGEGGMSNMAHLLLYGALALAAILGWRKPDNRLALTLWASAILAFLLFSGYLRWQPWHTRLHLPIFVFAAIPAGWMLGRLPAKWTAAPLLVLFGGVAIYASTQNTLRPLTGPYSIFDAGRTATLFSERRADGPSYEAALASIASSGCRKVGVIGGRSHFYYPAFVLLGGFTGEREIRFLRQEGSAVEPPDYRPCALFCVECAGIRARAELMRQFGLEVREFADHQVGLKPPTAAPALAP
ncbi:hypothetical protein [Paludibaculum fermentans]|uniref:hypothetical protein n=1 Tax=Paludibaculum fermentans TaxID=1473598 RepID=UPI003EBBE3EC